MSIYEVLPRPGGGKDFLQKVTLQIFFGVWLTNLCSSVAITLRQPYR